MDQDAQRIRVEALGQPGQRRFRLRALIGGETWVAWREKHQVQALGLALEQMLEQSPDGPGLASSGGAIALAEFDTETRRQFRVGRMELGYDERTDRLVIIAHDVNETDVEADPALTCRLTREQATDLSAEAAAVVAAGRPRCTMCGAPMGPGPHACPQQNGHFPRYLSDLSAEEED
ncbi:MAG: DUF3090 family protein [Chloroflexota bacterium]